jgi:hypothetical protein
MEADEARERGTAGADPVVPSEGETASTVAFAESLRMVLAKDRVALSAALDRFASLIAKDEVFRELRFDEDAFARLAVRLPPSIAGFAEPSARARLFRSAIGELATQECVQRLRHRIAGAMSIAGCSLLDREAIAAALVCLDPVLAEPPLPARESPTLEIIFNNQMDAWTRGARAISSDPTERAC